jgi:hypothetical protein
MAQQGLAADGVQHFGATRFEPGTLAGCHDYHSQVCGLLLPATSSVAH